MSRVLCNDGVDNLLIAVIKRAADDYRKAICDVENSDVGSVSYKNAITTRNECAKFFKTTFEEGEGIINKINNQMKEFNYSMRAWRAYLRKQNLVEDDI